MAFFLSLFFFFFAVFPRFNDPNRVVLCSKRLDMVHELSLGYHFAPELMIFHSKFASSILEGVE